jgi:hypothetical protein
LLFRFANETVVTLDIRGNGMFTTKLNVVVPVLGIIIASIQPAFALSTVPAPLVGAGLPALAVLGGGYWLIKKLRGPR